MIHTLAKSARPTRIVKVIYSQGRYHNGNQSGMMLWMHNWMNEHQLVFFMCFSKDRFMSSLNPLPVNFYLSLFSCLLVLTIFTCSVNLQITWHVCLFHCTCMYLCNIWLEGSLLVPFENGNLLHFINIEHWCHLTPNIPLRVYLMSMIIALPLLAICTKLCTFHTRGIL